MHVNPQRPMGPFRPTPLPPHIIFRSHYLKIMDRSPNCCVAVIQRVMAIITLMTLQMTVWVHYTN